MPNHNLTQAKKAKNDEFYTQWEDIEKEVMAYIDYNKNVFKEKTILLPCDDPEWSNFTKFFVLNFHRFGLKKLISTSYAANSKPHQLGLWEENSPKFDKDKTKVNGKIFVMDSNTPKNIQKPEELEWDYLKGDGDFRSEEITKLKEESDVIITNPPFSLFRDFISWVNPKEKKLLVIGNMNAITYKEIFPLIKENNLWVGPTISSGDREFQVPKSYPIQAAGWRINDNGEKFIRVKGVRWFTNLAHGKRHQPLSLMTLKDNLKYSKHKEIKGLKEYQKYDNYDAIEIPFTDAIPSDYPGVMGVPISFLDKYCPEQFEILGNADDKNYYNPIFGKAKGRITINKKQPFKRLFIKHKAQPK